MKKSLLGKLLLPSIIFLLSLVYFTGVMDVPFHPDESTQIFMSEDVNLFLTRPSQLAYDPENSENLCQKYRLLDPPLSRWFIGTARIITQTPPLQSDWDWSKSWQENVQAGALPDYKTLFISRIAVCFVFPLLLYVAYKTGETLRDRTTGWLTLALTAFNALVLLHTRRAMSESLLLFFTWFSIFLMVQKKKPAWLLAIPVALAFNAKYSTAPLILAGALYCLISCSHTPNPLRQRLATTGLYLSLIVLITFLLNPVLWSSPLEALQAAVIERQTLLTAQMTAIGGFNPSQAPHTLGGRLLAMLAQIFIAPPAVADVGNYLAATELQTKIYFSRPWNNLTNGFVRGGFFFSLSLIGMIWMIRETLRSKGDLTNPRNLFLIAFLFQFSGIIISIPLSFQRYYLPLLPYVITFIAYAVSAGFHIGINPVKSTGNQSQK